jgi:hypothetical protein
MKVQTCNFKTTQNYLNLISRRTIFWRDFTYLAVKLPIARPLLLKTEGLKKKSKESLWVKQNIVLVVTKTKKRYRFFSSFFRGVVFVCSPKQIEEKIYRSCSKLGENCWIFFNAGNVPSSLSTIFVRVINWMIQIKPRVQPLKNKKMLNNNTCLRR